MLISRGLSKRLGVGTVRPVIESGNRGEGCQRMADWRPWHGRVWTGRQSVLEVIGRGTLDVRAGMGRAFRNRAGIMGASTGGRQ